MWPFSRKKEEVAVEPPVVRKYRPTLRKRFDAADVSRLTQSWTTASTSPDQVIFQNLRILRARAREQAQNNDYVKRFMGMLRTNVVGAHGVIVQAQVNDMRAAGNDIAAQNAIEDAFANWGRRKNCDLTHAQSFVQMQHLVISTLASDGEVFVRYHQRGDFGLQLELIDPELIDLAYNDKYKGNRIMFGIEFNSLNQVVAYHVKVGRGTEDSYTSIYNNKDYVRVPADEIEHIFIREMIGQKRGIPLVATGLTRMRMLQLYEDASLIAAKIGASKMGFFTSENSEAEYLGDGIDEDGVPFEEAEAGVFGVLPTGMKFESFNPDYPKGEFADFMKATLRGLASGLGVSYNTLANDLEGVNFSSMRHGAIEERELWKCIQEWFIDAFIQPVYERWIIAAYKNRMLLIDSRQGRVPLRGPLSQYSKATFQARRWDWVDPLKDIQAKTQEVKLGVTSISAIIREKGGDIDLIRAELAQDLEFLKSIGLTVEGQSPQPDQQQGDPNA